MRDSMASSLHANPGTELQQRADVAFRTAGDADRPAVPDHSVAEVDPFLARQKLAQILFDFNGVGLRRQAESAGDPADVRIDHYTRGNPKCRAENHVGRLA